MVCKESRSSFSLSFRPSTANMRILSKFYVLTLKNFMLKGRHWISTIFEIVIPVALFAILAILRFVDDFRLGIDIDVYSGRPSRIQLTPIIQWMIQELIIITIQTLWRSLLTDITLDVIQMLHYSIQLQQSMKQMLKKSWRKWEPLPSSCAAA